MKFSNPDWKFIKLAIGLTALAIVASQVNAQLVLFFDWFFEIKNFNLCAGGLIAIFSFLKDLKAKKYKLSSSMSFTDFRKPIELLISFIGTPITFACGISLIKGWYYETFRTVEYFPLFKDYEISFIGLVAAYLLFISIMDFWRDLKGTLFNPRSETPIATPPAPRRSANA